MATRVERTVTIAASRARVWKVLVSSEHLRDWFSDGDASLEPRPGGELRFTWDGHGTFHGRVEEVREEELLAFRWARHPGEEPAPGRSTLVRIALEKAGNGTRVTLEETGFPELEGSAQERADYATENDRGWQHQLLTLRAYAESRLV